MHAPTAPRPHEPLTTPIVYAAAEPSAVVPTSAALMHESEFKNVGLAPKGCAQGSGRVSTRAAVRARVSRRRAHGALAAQ